MNRIWVLTHLQLFGIFSFWALIVWFCWRTRRTSAIRRTKTTYIYDQTDENYVHLRSNWQKTTYICDHTDKNYVYLRSDRENYVHLRSDRENYILLRSNWQKRRTSAIKPTKTTYSCDQTEETMYICDQNGKNYVHLQSDWENYVLYVCKQTVVGRSLQQFVWASDAVKRLTLPWGTFTAVPFLHLWFRHFLSVSPTAKFHFCFCWQSLHLSDSRSNFCSTCTSGRNTMNPKRQNVQKEVELKVRDLHAVAQSVQLLVVDWPTAVRWAGLRPCRRWSRRQDLVAARNSFHCREGADFSPRNFLFVHLHRL